ncbi:MAG: hypothetical protein ACRCZ0_03035 [Cetobacterium sp.]
MDFKEQLLDNVTAQMKTMVSESYKTGYSEGVKRERNRMKKSEDNAYIVIDNDTYVELEYEARTNRRRFGFDLDSLKQTYLERGCLTRDGNNKYIPSNTDLFKLVDGKLYMNQDELCILYLVYNKQRTIVKKIDVRVEAMMKRNFNNILECVYSISNVESKQKNPMFCDLKKRKAIDE